MNNMRTNSPNSAGPGLYFLGLLSPFVTFLVALRNFRSGWAKNVVWFFIVFYGFTFVISNESLDAARYRNELVKMYKAPIGSFADFWLLLYNKETNYVDILQPLITFVLSRVTDNPHILFAVFGLIFGFFYTRNVWYLIDRTSGRLSITAATTLAIFCLVVAFWQLNGFRFYTAVHVFIYGVFIYAEGKKWKGFLFAAFSILIHFSMVLPFFLMAIYYLVGNRIVIIFGLYFASFFVSQISPAVFKQYSESLPAVFQNRTEKYVSDPYLKARAKQAGQSLNWYVNGRMTALQYAINICLVWLFLNHKRNLTNCPQALSLLCLGLLIGSVANISASLPSAIRFLSILYLLTLASFFLLTQSTRRDLFPAVVMLPFVVASLLYIVVEVRIGFYTIGVMTVVGNPVTALFVESNTALIDLIK